MDDVRRLKNLASAKLSDPELQRGAGKIAGDAVSAAAQALDGLEAVARRSGMTTRKGKVSKVKLAKALVTPRQSARTVLDAAAAQINDRRASQVPSPDATAAPIEPRDIPMLFPSFYEDQLHTAAKPVTENNIAAVAGLTSANIALNAHRWLEIVGTPEEHRQWEQEFFSTDGDLAAMARRPDRMIDFLWNVSPRLHPGLRDLVEQMKDTITSAAGRFGPELPIDMWTESDH
jgi:hypothetical protein